jgi:transcriptional regulator with XRE-family HTH domain
MSVAGDFGKLLRTERKRVGLSQEALAKRVGVARTSITNLEQGTQSVGLELLLELSSALGIEPSTLLPRKPAGSAQAPLPKTAEGLREDEKEWVLRVITKGRALEEEK